MGAIALKTYICIGGMPEQYILEQLISDKVYTPFYFSGEKSTFETDFLIQKGVDIVQIEVNAETNLSPSRCEHKGVDSRRLTEELKNY